MRLLDDRDSHRAGELEESQRMSKSLPPGTSDALSFMKLGPTGHESLLSLVNLPSWLSHQFPIPTGLNETLGKNIFQNKFQVII